MNANTWLAVVKHKAYAKLLTQIVVNTQEELSQLCLACWAFDGNDMVSGLPLTRRTVMTYSNDFYTIAYSKIYILSVLLQSKTFPVPQYARHNIARTAMFNLHFFEKYS
jgi:hypothetical protein